MHGILGSIKIKNGCKVGSGSMEDKALNDLSIYWNLIRGMVRTEDYITAMILVDEVKKECTKNSNIDSADAIYAALLKAANGIGVINPFQDKERFFVLYQESCQFTGLDWEKAIAQICRMNRLPILPRALLDIMEERFSKDPETVLIAEADKFVPNLQKIVDGHINSRFTLTSMNTVHIKALEKVFADYDNVEIVFADIYQYGFMNKRFDLIISCPNFGGRTLAEEKTFMCREYDMVALENLSFHLNNGGELVIVLPGRITFAFGKISDLRQFIQQNYTIRELAELPEGILEYCGLKTYLLDIENKRPEGDDIVVRKYSAGKHRSRKAVAEKLDISEDTFVMLEELEEQGDWSIDRIFAQQDEMYMQYQNSNIRKEQIGNAAQIFRGKAITRKNPVGRVGVVNISNIGEYEIDYENLDYIDEEERKISNYLLREGDLLLPARGTAIRTAVFSEKSYPCIAHSNVIVIRPNEKILDSVYLKIFLDSPLGNKVISSAQQGTAVMNISYKDLAALEIPLPPLEEQKLAAEEYMEELKRYKESIMAAEKRWNEVLNKLQNF